eukprot:COSAG01_NODE_4546_length_4932_cov_10.841092_3_plen_62_part_00
MKIVERGTKQLLAEYVFYEWLETALTCVIGMHDVKIGSKGDDNVETSGKETKNPVSKAAEE